MENVYVEVVAHSPAMQSCPQKVFWKVSQDLKKKLWRSLVFSKFVGCRPSTSLKKEPCHRCCPVSFAKFSTYFVNHLQTTGSLYYQTNISKEKSLLVHVHSCSFIWFNYNRCIKAKEKYFWFVYKFKMKFVRKKIFSLKPFGKDATSRILLKINKCILTNY